MSLEQHTPVSQGPEPLAALADRLPQAWARFSQPASDSDISHAEIRPFGLRFAVEPGRTTTVRPPWRYCPDRQIAVSQDGTPWHRQLVDMTMSTTGPSPDGTGNTGGEEWSPDYLSDEPADPV